MKTRFLVVLGITLLGVRLAVAQFWSVGGHIVPGYSIPGGITGQSILRIDYFDPEFGAYHDNRQYPTSIEIRTASGKYVTTVRTDARGRFQVVLRPGKYMIKPRTTSANTLLVTVRSARFLSVIVRSYTHGYVGGVSNVTRPPPPWPPFDHPVTICHKGQTIQVSSSTLSAHLIHGDTIGPCDQ